MKARGAELLDQVRTARFFTTLDLTTGWVLLSVHARLHGTDQPVD